MASNNENLEGTRKIAIRQVYVGKVRRWYMHNNMQHTLPGINDTQHPPQRKVYHMLKYMHDHYIDEFDFFMRSDDDVYVKTDQLLELLQSINPAQDIYMGCPGFGRLDDRDRI